MSTQHILGWLLIFISAWATIASFLAHRFYLLMKDYKRANDIRARSIEETRAGHPPFLLNPGVKITIEDPAPVS